jgi:hypothetical protein
MSFALLAIGVVLMLFGFTAVGALLACAGLLIMLVAVTVILVQGPTASDAAPAPDGEPDWNVTLGRNEFAELGRHIGHLVRVHDDSEGFDTFECLTCRTEMPVPLRMFPASGKLHRWGSCGPRYLG